MIDAERAEEARRKLLGISRWIDESPGYEGIDPEAALWRRITKISIEANEALDAFCGVLGENPRKGVTNGWDKVDYEILDAATAALGAFFHRHDNDPDCDPLTALFQHIEQVYDRAGRP